MYILRQQDVAVSQMARIMVARKYPKLRVETIPNANHFLHQDAPDATNVLLRNFLESASNYTVKKVLTK